MSRILIVTPTRQSSRQGNQVTANRWAGLLRSLRHRVEIADGFDRQACDILIALHARKSAAALQRFAGKHPDKPIVLGLTGTDLYGDIQSSEAAQRSLELARRLVLLQPHGRRELPRRLREKTRVIHQSVEPLNSRPAPLKSVFEVCVSGHLRSVKDPFRAAMAARRLPATSKIRITHLGGALSAAMEERARAEMQRNPRYRWRGEVSRGRARRLLARSRLLVLSSKLEGGANVISEALAAAVPILSSRISGSIGLLSEDYPGYFTVGDTKELAQLMLRCERDGAFYRQLTSHCRRLRPLVKPARERAAWRELIEELVQE